MFRPECRERMSCPLPRTCMTQTKIEVLALALSAPSQVFTVNVDPREREAVTTVKVGLAQALQPDGCLHDQRYAIASRPRTSRWTR